MRFEMFQSQQDRQFYFELVDDNGQTLLSSGGFPDQESCTNAIRDLIQALPLENRYSVQSIAGGAQLSILNAAGTALATSPVLAGTAAAAAARDAYLADAADNREYEVRVTTYTRKTVQLSDDYAFLSDIDFSKFYDFTRASTSGRAGFEPFQAGNEQYYFHFNDADGKAILFSRDFPTPFQRDKRIRSIIKAAGKSERYEIIEADGTFFFILKASNHQEIARSRNFGSREAAEAAIAYCQANIPPYKSEYPEPEKKKSRKGVNEYNLDLRPDSSDAGFATLRNADDKGHYFFFLNASGQPILFSQSYSGARGRDNGIRAVIRNAGTADRYERHQEDGVYYFVLRAANRQEIARSADFESEADLEAAIRYLTLQAPTYAGAYEVTLETEETSSFTLDFVAPPAPAPEPVVADRREDNYLTCKLYHGHPRSETYPDFSTFEHNGEYYFAMLDEDGEVVFRSEGYTSVSARDNGIQSVMKNREIEERYSIEERMGAHFLVLKAGNHQEIARSCAKGDESGARYYLPSVWTARREAALAALAAAATPAVTAPVADRREDNYLACRMYSGHPRSEAYPDFSTFEHNGEYYFAMLDKDGEVVLRSEGYTSTAARDNGIQSVLKNREIEERFSVEEKMNRYFLVLKAGNHQEIARSCAKEEEAGAWAWWTGWKSAAAAAAALSAVAAIPDPEPTPVVEAEPVAVSKDKEDDYLACKEYQGKHVNDKRNNVALFKHSNGQYYFAVITRTARFGCAVKASKQQKIATLSCQVSSKT